MAMLTWERKDGQRMVFHLQGLEATVGRDVGNLVRLESGYVSKRHAVIRLGPQGYTITDLNSSNGTYVNSQRISLSLLKDGDRIEFGSEVLVFSNAPAGAPVGPPPAAAPARSPKLLIAVGAGTVVVVLLIALVVIGSRAGKARRPAAESVAAPAAAAPQAMPDPGAAPAPVSQENYFGGAPPASTDSLAMPAPNPSSMPPAATPPAAAAPAGVDPTATEPPLPSNDPMALYEMALAHVNGNRLVEARRLLRGSVRIDPSNTSAQQRLRQVEATIQVQADQHLASGQRAFTYLRYDDAIIEFEQVMQMLPATDPRYQQAAAGYRRSKERLGR